MTLRKLLPVVLSALLILATAPPDALSQGRGGRGAAAATPPGPPAPVPAAVAIPRPSDAELEAARAALSRFASTDAAARSLLQKYPGLIEVTPPRPNTAIRPSLSQGFMAKHQANLEVAKQGNANVLFMGDSITDFWRGSNPPYDGKAVFDKYFSQWTVANFGIAGDTTQGVLYRLQDGEGKGFTPKAIMLMIGTNNRLGNTAAEIAEGVGAVVLALQQDFPNARILLLGVFPTGAAANDPARATIAEINKIIAKLNDGTRVRYLDIGKGFLDADGNIPADVMSDALHPTAKGYEIWAKAVIEPLSALMGTPVPAVK